VESGRITRHRVVSDASMVVASIFQRVIGNLVVSHTHREVGLVVNGASHGSGHDEMSSDEAVRASVALGGARDGSG
jgi:hypothetical protein